MSEQNQWRPWFDPNAVATLKAYEDTGYVVLTPDAIRAMPADDRQHVLHDCLAVLGEVFDGKYPLTVKYAAQLDRGVVEGRSHPFAVCQESATGPVVGTLALVQKSNYTNGPLQRVEMGRVGKLAGAPSLARLIRYRPAWAQAHLPDADFLLSSMRSSLQGDGKIPSGQHILKIWLRPDRGPVVPNHVGWLYRVGGLEPFMNVCIPTDPIGWGESVPDTPVFVPSEAEQQKLLTLLDEGTYGNVTPDVRVANPRQSDDFPLKQGSAPDNHVVTDYIVSANAPDLASVDLADTDAQLLEGISQRVFIETDVASTPKGASAVAKFLERGWTFVGWNESEQVMGGLCLVLARVNPSHLMHLNAAGHTPQLFDANGLAGTRRVFDEAYTDMGYHAASHPKARLTL
jgi:hypothetical protein